MEKVKFKSLLALLLILTTATPSFAIWKVVTDPHCLKVVTTNLATQKAIEGQHNHRLDSIASKKKKLELYTVSMATIKELLSAGNSLLSINSCRQSTSTCSRFIMPAMALAVAGMEPSLRNPFTLSVAMRMSCGSPSP